MRLYVTRRMQENLTTVRYFVLYGMMIMTVIITRNSAVAERPRVLYVIQHFLCHSRSLKVVRNNTLE